MNRYQIYLNPQHVNTLDDLAHDLDISRSQIIRDVVSRVSHQYKMILDGLGAKQAKKDSFLYMAGCIKSPTGTVSRNINEIYLQD